MNYRFAKISGYYRDFLNKYYQDNPYIKNVTHNMQFTHLVKQGYGYADYFSRHMRALENPAIDIITTEHLQVAWAREHKIPGNIIIEQLKAFKPDVVLFQSSIYFDPLVRLDFKMQVPSIKMFIRMYGAPEPEHYVRNFGSYDAILCHSPKFVQIAKQYNPNSYLFYHAIEESLCKRIVQKEKTTDALFIGSLINSNDFHSERIQFIEKVLQGTDVSIISNPKPDKLYLLKAVMFYLTRILKRIGAKKILRLPVIRKFAAINELKKPVRLSPKFKDNLSRQSLFGLEMLEQLTSARIGINTHAGIAGNYAANVRMFEITGAGVCMLTDDKENIRDLFDPGFEIMTYKSAEDCIDMIKYLLKHPDFITEIARKGQARTMKDHTVQKRVEQLNQIIIKHLKS